jgi:predicted dehydrogenase
MVGHTFLFNAGVQALKECIRSGRLGTIHYLHAERTNLGPIRQDVNALVDLAPHDISIFLELMGRKPLAVSAHGASYVRKGREDVVFLNLFFPGNVLANIHVSWLEPCKVRRVTVIGSRKMAVFDDIDVSETIKIYDKGVMKAKRYASFGEFQLVLRDGDIQIPKVSLSEPLKNQCRHFLEAVRGEAPLRSGPDSGLRVVQVMDAALTSLHAGGKTVPLRP